MSLEVKGWWGLVLPPCLLITAVQQPGTSSPPSRLKHSSTGLIRMCRASFTNSSCPLPWSSMVVSSQWIRWWFSHACSATADFSIIPLSQASRCSFNLVSSLRLVSPMFTWLQLQGIGYTTLDCYPAHMRKGVKQSVFSVCLSVCPSGEKF